MYKWNLYQLIPYINQIKYIIPSSFVSYLATHNWNIETLTFVDMLAGCKRNGITLLEAPMSVLPAMFTVESGLPVILLNSKLTEPFRTFVLSHEMAHYSLDSSHVCLYATTMGREQMECRANVIAACALIPQEMLRTLSTADLTNLFGYPLELIRFRRAVYQYCSL
jgi:Zn-dependent peptidase ImmA (M78 family)